VHMLQGLSQSAGRLERRTGVQAARKRKGSLAVAKDEVRPTRPKRKFRGKLVKGTAVARGCGCVANGRRKRTKGAVEQS